MTGIIYFIALANAYGWEDKNTHPEISEYATMLYIAPYSDATDFLDSPLNGLTIRNFIRAGAKNEDLGTPLQFINGTARSMNHFHNPTQPDLSKAGLSDKAGFSDYTVFSAFLSPVASLLISSLPDGESALLWAQDKDNQIKKGIGGEWSWKTVRGHYYNSLTKPDQKCWKRCQALHLGI